MKLLIVIGIIIVVIIILIVCNMLHNLKTSCKRESVERKTIKEDFSNDDDITFVDNINNSLKDAINTCRKKYAPCVVRAG